MDLLTNKRVVFIGAGNMAEALVNGLVKGDVCTPPRITVTDIRAERLGHFRIAFGVTATEDNRQAVQDADLVVLAVKPQVMDEVLAGLKGALEPGCLVISIAAGLRTERIEKALGEGTRVVRVMPNTPALVGAGVAAICPGTHATEDDLGLTEVLMGSVGVVVRLREEDMDAVTAVSGSGPAYVFYLMEAMLEAAGQMGLAEDVAQQLVYGTVYGAAKLIMETGVPAGELRQRVTSKGGTTEAALKVLQRESVLGVFVEALRAAEHRSKELSGPCTG